ncbi:MAG: DUF3180 domain-containing protein [Actinobacteria bacterium]|nr:DUF3180 domain-containing protein [Actinomycetota bacterium]MCB9411357.1 DUF3180 domain-containing protein [Actinomycetota bacterium]
MTPTRLPMLAVVAAIATTMGWAVADIVDNTAQRSIPVPWSSVITVGACAVVLAGWAWNLRRRIRFDAGPVDPFLAVRSAALAMAASRAGAVTAGGYAGIGLWFSADLGVPIARERALICAAGVVVSFALVAAAYWLEKICRLPGDDDESSPPAPEGDSDADWVHPHQSLRGAGAPAPDGSLGSRHGL